jgi:putative peptidoglycan lipid II flippase
VLLYPHLAHRGLALSTSLAAAANVLVLAIVFRVRHGGAAGHGVASTLTRAGLASAVMGAVAFGASVGIERVLGSGPIWTRLCGVLVPIGLAGGVYVLLLKLLRVEEAEAVLRMAGKIVRRFKR